MGEEIIKVTEDISVNKTDFEKLVGAAKNYFDIFQDIIDFTHNDGEELLNAFMLILMNSLLNGITASVQDLSESDEEELKGYFTQIMTAFVNR